MIKVNNKQSAFTSIKNGRGQEWGEYTYILDTDTPYSFEMTHDELNAAILEDFYKGVSWLLSQGYDEYRELISRTIDPAGQNMFLPLREYRVKRNGHYRTVEIGTRFLGGVYISLKAK